MQRKLFVPLVCAAWVSLSLCRPGQAEDWMQFRGPGGSGVSAATGLPAEFGEDRNLAWKVELPGAGSSSPITLGDRVFVTCYSGYGIRRGEGQLEDLTLHVVCVDRSDGREIWQKALPAAEGEAASVRDHGYAASTPATDGKNVYAFFGKTGVFAFDLDGNQLWHASVGSGVHRGGWGSGSSPVVYQDIVIVNASVESGALVGLDKNTGKELWRAGGMQAAWNTPCLVETAAGDVEVVVSVRGKILAFDPKNGQPLWQCDGISDYVCPSIVASEGVVYSLGGRQSRAIAVRAGGRGQVEPLWDVASGANVASPVVHDGHLYWVSERNSTAYCCRLEDGAEVYRERVKGSPYASAVLADGKLYVVTRRDGILVLAARPEFELLAHNRMEDRAQFNASPAISNGQILIRSDQILYCFANP